MGLRKILTDKDPALHKVCRPVEKFDWRLHKLLNDMDIILKKPGNIHGGGRIDSQQIICRHLEQTSQLDNVLCRGCRYPLLPCIDAGTCNTKLLCQIRLRKTPLLPDCFDSICDHLHHPV